MVLAAFPSIASANYCRYYFDRDSDIELCEEVNLRKGIVTIGDWSLLPEVPDRKLEPMAKNYPLSIKGSDIHPSTSKSLSLSCLADIMPYLEVNIGEMLTKELNVKYKFDDGEYFPMIDGSGFSRPEDTQGVVLVINLNFIKSVLEGRALSIKATRNDGSDIELVYTLNGGDKVKNHLRCI